MACSVAGWLVNSLLENGFLVFECETLTKVEKRINLGIY